MYLINHINTYCINLIHYSLNILLKLKLFNKKLLINTLVMTFFLQHEEKRKKNELCKNFS